MKTSDEHRDITLPWLDCIRYCRLRFFYRAIHSGCIDCFLGPEIRNAIGPILKQSCGCTGHREEDCVRCPGEKKKDCLYARFYDHGNDGSKGWVLRLDPVFRGMKNDVDTCETLGFDLILIGTTAKDARGLIKSIGSDRLTLGGKGAGASFEIVEAGFVNPEGAYAALSPPDDAPILPIVSPTITDVDTTLTVRRVELMMHTPTEITVSHGKYLYDPAAFTFKLFVLRMFQRTEDIARLFCGWKGEGRHNYSAQRLVKMAQTVTTHPSTRAGWRKVDLRTHPTRRTGGIVGKFTFEGEMMPFLPIFDAAARLGIGKKTALGYGLVSYRIVPESED